VWAAGSVHPGGVLGTLQDGWFGLVGVRYHRLLLPVRRPNVPPADGPTLTYTADAIPVARVRVPKGTPPNTHASSIRSVTEEGLSTYGFGLYPLGLRVGFRPSSALRPFVAGHTGLFYLFDAMPDERGRHTNFAVGIGGGVEISLGRRATLTLGYRYHHLSNGFRGRINPGLDANLLYVDLGTTL
jgi:opacity protein-like surface antigen